MNSCHFRYWLVLLLTVLCGATGRAQLARGSQSDNSSSPFGLNASAWSHLGANTDNFDEAQGERRLGLLRESGAKWDRVDFWWGRIEPRRGEFVWRDYDRVVDKYQRAGVSLMPILAYASAWSNGVAPATDQERALYGRFVYNTVRRYRGRVHVWEIWNEPNIGQFWSPVPRARDYAALLQVAYREAKRADPTCTVVGAATALVDYGFIEDLLELGCGRFMDAISIHPYQGDLGSVGPEQGGLVNSIGSLKKLLAAYGVRLPIYITEMGYTTRPGGKVGEDEQANYLVRSYALALAAGVHRLFWFNLHDWEEHWGLVRPDFSQKPSFTAYQTLARSVANLKPAALLGFGGSARGVLFTRNGSTLGHDTRVAVVWATGDAQRVTLGGRRAYDVTGVPVGAGLVTLGPRPVFVVMPRLNNASLRPLPAWPTHMVRAPRGFTPIPPPLPTPAKWTEPAFERRALVSLTAGEGTAGAPLRITIPNVSIDAIVVRLDAAGNAMGRVVAQRDAASNALVWMAPPNARPQARLFYVVYWQGNRAGQKTNDDSTTLSAKPNWVENQQLRLETPGGKTIARIIHKPSGWMNQGAEVSGLFAASYNDSANGWPRLDPDAELVETRRESGPVFARVTSRVRFGRDRPDYVWSVTLYRGSSRVDWTGKWLNRGTGAKKFIHLGTSFPPGTQVRGPYSAATLPQTGASYGKWALIPAVPDQPAEVGMLLVAPNRNLSTPGWSKHAVVGVGSLYEDTVPAQVEASLFILPRRAATGEEAARLYRQVAFPARVRVGVVQRRPRSRR